MNKYQDEAYKLLNVVMDKIPEDYSSIQIACLILSAATNAATNGHNLEALAQVAYMQLAVLRLELDELKTNNPS